MLSPKRAFKAAMSDEIKARTPAESTAEVIKYLNAFPKALRQEGFTRIERARDLRTQASYSLGKLGQENHSLTLLKVFIPDAKQRENGQELATGQSIVLSCATDGSRIEKLRLMKEHSAIERGDGALVISTRGSQELASYVWENKDRATEDFTRQIVQLRKLMAPAAEPPAPKPGG